MPFASDWWNWWGLRRIGTSRSSDTVGWRLRRSDWEILADRSSILLISFPAIASQCSKTSEDSPNSISIDFDTPNILNRTESPWSNTPWWCRSLLHTHGPEGTNDFKQDASEEPAVSDKGGRKTMEAVACIENVRNEMALPDPCTALHTFVVNLNTAKEELADENAKFKQLSDTQQQLIVDASGSQARISTISMAAFDLSKGIGDCTRMIQDVAVALCQPLIGYGVVFSIPKVLLKNAIQKQLRKASVKLGHPTCKKTHMQCNWKNKWKKRQTKKQEKKQRLSFFVVFSRFFCPHPTPKRKKQLVVFVFHCIFFVFCMWDMCCF